MPWPPPSTAVADPVSPKALRRGQRWLARTAASADLDSRRPWWQRYRTAASAVLIALGARVLSDPLLGTRGTYGFFLVATIYVAWRRGLGPAIATVCSGAVLGIYFFEFPQGIQPFSNIADFVPLGLSLTVGIGAALVCEMLRMMAAEYARMYREAREADRRKDDFLAMLAHELRNPLAPIRNALYVLDFRRHGDAQAEELHRIISDQVNHLVRLVDDLLDVARIKQGRIELRPEPIDAKRFVQAALEVARPLIEEKKHHLYVVESPQPLHLLGDPVRLTQALANLLNNAAKYSPEGSRIWLSVEHDDEQIAVRVRDTGIGLTAEQISRIFGLFEQADPSIERSRGGLGIGLTLARIIVERHGGKLEVTSPGPDLGSEFTIRLPLDPTAAPAADAATPKSRVEPTLDKPLRILVVEDLAVTAQSLAQVLRMWGHEVETAGDGFAGLERARAMRPDVVLTDLGMPQMNGYQLAEELRRLPQLKETVLIAVSGYGQARDRQRSHEAGFEQHLTKPIQPEELRAILNAIAVRRASLTTAE